MAFQALLLPPRPVVLARLHWGGHGRVQTLKSSISFVQSNEHHQQGSDWGASERCEDFFAHQPLWSIVVESSKLFEKLMDVYASLFVFIRLRIPRNLTHLAKDFPICAATKLCLSWTKVKSRSQYTCYAIELSSYSTWLLAPRVVMISHANLLQLLFWSIFLYHQICVRNWAIYVVKAMNSDEFDRFSWRFLSLLLQNFVSLKRCWKMRS